VGQRPNPTIVDPRTSKREDIKAGRRGNKASHPGGEKTKKSGKKSLLVGDATNRKRIKRESNVKRGRKNWARRKTGSSSRNDPPLLQVHSRKQKGRGTSDPFHNLEKRYLKTQGLENTKTSLQQRTHKRRKKGSRTPCTTRRCENRRT